MTTATGAQERRRAATSREAIAAAAVPLFAERGFSGTSVRDIARAADVDPAVVVRRFGSKEALFLEVMSVPGDFRRVVEGPLEGVGTAIVSHLLTGPDAGRRVYTALMRATDRPEVRAALERANEANLIGPLAARLPGPAPRLRAALVSAALTGLLQSLWIVEEPALTEQPTARLVADYGAFLQTLIDAP